MNVTLSSERVILPSEPLPPHLQVNPLRAVYRAPSRWPSLLLTLAVAPGVLYLGLSMGRRALKTAPVLYTLAFNDSSEGEFEGGSGPPPGAVNTPVPAASEPPAETPGRVLPALPLADLSLPREAQADPAALPNLEPGNLMPLNPERPPQPLPYGGNGTGGRGGGTAAMAVAGAPGGSGRGGRGSGQDGFSFRTGKGLPVVLESLHILHSEVPRYPKEAVAKNLSGTVVASLVINEGGLPIQWEITEGVDPLLDNEVLKACPLWRFQGVSYEGNRVRANFEIKFIFIIPSFVVN